MTDFLRKTWRAWKRLGTFIGDWLARVVLTLFYFTIFAPFGLGVRYLADPLDMKPQKPPFWQSRDESHPDLETARKLF